MTRSTHWIHEIFPSQKIYDLLFILFIGYLLSSWLERCILLAFPVHSYIHFYFKQIYFLDISWIFLGYFCEPFFLSVIVNCLLFVISAALVECLFWMTSSRKGHVIPTNPNFDGCPGKQPNRKFPIRQHNKLPKRAPQQPGTFIANPWPVLL